MKNGKVVDATIKVHGRNLVLMNSYCDESLRGSGALVIKKEYRISSLHNPDISVSRLCLPGTEPEYDDIISTCPMKSHQEALEARDAFMALLDLINAIHAEPEKVGKPRMNIKEFREQDIRVDFVGIWTHHTGGRTVEELTDYDWVVIEQIVKSISDKIEEQIKLKVQALRGEE